MPRYAVVTVKTKKELGGRPWTFAPRGSMDCLFGMTILTIILEPCVRFQTVCVRFQTVDGGWLINSSHCSQIVELTGGKKDV